MADTPDEMARKLNGMNAGKAESAPVTLTEDEDTGDRFLIYSTDRGIEVQLRYENEALWMTQAQIAALFGVDRTVVTRHLQNIYAEGELAETATSARIAHVRREGGRTVSRELLCYDINAVISVGYRVSSRQATMFRVWATDKLVQFATKGFVIDAQRLKNADDRDHLRELRDIIRDIRASEANVYKELRRIISLCSDYAELDDDRKNAFFAAVQNKLLFAVVGMTAAELRLARASATRPNMGLTSWPGRNPARRDVLIAKNYLADPEIRDLNRFTTMLLDYFEQETDLGRLVLTADAERAVDRFIKNNDRALLLGAGTATRRDADLYCEAEFDKFSEVRRLREQTEDDDG